MKYWLARALMFLAVCLIRVVRLLGVFQTWTDEVLQDEDDHAQSDLIQLQDVIKAHTNRFISDFFDSIKQRMPWNR